MGFHINKDSVEQKYETYFIKELCTMIKKKKKKNHQGLWIIIQVRLIARTEKSYNINLQSKFWSKSSVSVMAACFFQTPLRPTCRPPLCWSTEAPNGVAGTVLVRGDPEQSAGRWSHESLSTENTLKDKHAVSLFIRRGIKSTYSTQYVTRKWAGGWRKFVPL